VFVVAVLCILGGDVCGGGCVGGNFYSKVFIFVPREFFHYSSRAFLKAGGGVFFGEMSVFLNAFPVVRTTFCGTLQNFGVF
jgi:hypothetical protein